MCPKLWCSQQPAHTAFIIRTSSWRLLVEAIRLIAAAAAVVDDESPTDASIVGGPLSSLPHERSDDLPKYSTILCVTQWQAVKIVTELGSCEKKLTLGACTVHYLCAAPLTCRVTHLVE